MKQELTNYLKESAGFFVPNKYFSFKYSHKDIFERDLLPNVVMPFLGMEGMNGAKKISTYH